MLGLALGSRASELHSLLRGPKFIVFSRNLTAVRILPNPAFLAKNESPLFRRQPMVISALFKRDGSRHSLCPVYCLSTYLLRTRAFVGDKVFFNPASGVQCNRGRMNFYVRKLVKVTQPGIYARFHDLRKFSVWTAFWNQMRFKDLRSRGFWRNNSVMARRYLYKATPSKSPCVALGVVCNTK